MTVQELINNLLLESKNPDLDGVVISVYGDEESERNIVDVLRIDGMTIQLLGGDAE